MKPSGGGNSDIFCSESLEEVPRSTKNHMRSSIFSEPENIGKNGEYLLKKSALICDYINIK